MDGFETFCTFSLGDGGEQEAFRIVKPLIISWKLIITVLFAPLKDLKTPWLKMSTLPDPNYLWPVEIFLVT